jgi:multidrug efflux pump subunit AcrB
MKFSHFFIDRPIFAMALSILVVLAGGVAYLTLPVAQYPEIVPPTVQIQATYPGADPQVLADTVAAPIEEQVNGVENMLYMSSQMTSDGNVTITVTFSLGTDIDKAQVLVQNRVSIAQARLPQEVQALGVSTLKQSPNLLMVVNLVSPDGTYRPEYVSNYALTQVKDPLSRLYGVGNVQIFGERDYSMRIWLDPNRMYGHSLTVNDVISAVQAQNVQVAAGQLEAEPARKGTEFTLTINTLGRLITPDQFKQIIVKRGSNGQIVYLADVAVEFAKQEIDRGRDRFTAATDAARLRLRPILMTSFAFTLGVLPLVVAKGPGAEMRQALGTAVFSGMIGVTLFGIFLTPVFFSVILKFFGPKPAVSLSPELNGTTTAEHVHLA